MSIRISYEAARGCGFRKVGGLYMVGDAPTRSCGLLPLLLERCPTCGHGIKFSRGFAWIDLREVIRLDAGSQCADSGTSFCQACPMNAPPERCGLVWVGERWYPTPRDFMQEAARMGISKRMASVPNDLVLGETWVLLAHRKAIQIACKACDAKGRVLEASHDEALGDIEVKSRVQCEQCDGYGTRWRPGIFGMFIPHAFEKVVSEDVSNDECEKLASRGIEPVIVRQCDEVGTPPMFTKNGDPIVQIQ